MCESDSRKRGEVTIFSFWIGEHRARFFPRVRATQNKMHPAKPDASSLMVDLLLF
jgi:hypothetical protein